MSEVTPFMRWAFLLWIVFLFALAMAPLPIKIQLHTTGRWHSAGHCFAFFVTALLLLWNAQGTRSEIIRASIVLALAFLMEWLENVFYHAGFEWHDIAFDCTGLISAWVIVSVFRSGPVSGQPTKIR